MENPYWLSLTSPNPAYLVRIAAFTGGFGALFLAVDRYVSRARAGTSADAISSPRQGAPDESRRRSGLSAATNVCSGLHALVTGVGAVWTVFRLYRGENVALAVNVWQWILAFSQGYFIADFFLYGTRREAWVLVHHAWMVIAHHPIGNPVKGCELMGVGDPSLSIWLSSTGYWAEVSTIFLVIRWMQIRLLKKHSIWYSVNSFLLLLTYPTTRVLGALLILFGSLWPRSALYKENGLHSLVVFTSITYTAMGLMSGFYFYTLVKKGFARALYFKPSTDKKEE